MQRVHFISGLPRSGSTLLGALLRQNPLFHAGMSSPVFSLLNSMMPRLSNANEFNVFIDDAARGRLLRGLFESYYADLGDKVVFDTNRSWTQKLPVLLNLYPEAKFVCCVRPVNEIIQSFERLYLESPLQLSQVIGFDPDTSIYVRADRLMAGNGLIGLALNALKEAFYGPHSDRLMLLSYENIAGRPKLAMEKLYEFLGEMPFAHDFGNIAYEASEFDAFLGAPGLHSVRKKVTYRKPKYTMPPDVLARFAGTPFWETDINISKAHTSLALPA
ncbi:MAG: sulfotransferase [Novosphingobium sp.]